jgi:hypothetical protein
LGKEEDRPLGQIDVRSEPAANSQQVALSIAFHFTDTLRILSFEAAARGPDRSTN